MKLEIEKDTLKISAVSSAGSTYDELYIDHFGDDLIIAFNNRYLIDSIKACSDERVLLSLSSPLTSMNIEPVEGHNQRMDAKKVLMGEIEEEIFMLLPVRMKE